ncbi:GDYXXLXY domain-containing protein [Candidatus Halobeggiatoa sp. HSG11]|nr:GDYXXLXY domain-containing protein [Candidatus Halobeggiatoa sp. HSG11]
MKRIIVFLTAVLILAAVNFEIYKKEQLLTEGSTILLELAPVDPRSLMQGDYMILRYKIAGLAEATGTEQDGFLVLALDENQVAHFVRIYQDEILQPSEFLLQFRKRGRGINLGSESFFFQEGHAHLYSKARYGELKVSKDGDSILIGLRDNDFNPLSSDNEVED